MGRPGGAAPAADLRAILDERCYRGGRIGIETDAVGLSLARGKEVETSLAGFCHLVEASNLVSRLRLVKSDAELAYVRRAAALADDAMLAAIGQAVPGTSDLSLFAAAHEAIFAGGGDYPASRFTMTSGANALIVRHYTGHGTILPRDQVTIELAGIYRHYHACLYWTVLTGEAHPRHRRMHEACAAAVAACQEACRPGNTVGAVFDAYAGALDGVGFGRYRMNACGYGLGAKYPPTWMDWPMIYARNPLVLEPNMVFFLQAFLIDGDRALTMSYGETIAITSAGCERLSRLDSDLVVH